MTVERKTRFGPASRWVVVLRYWYDLWRDGGLGVGSPSHADETNGRVNKARLNDVSDALCFCNGDDSICNLV